MRTRLLAPIPLASSTANPSDMMIPAESVVQGNIQAAGRIGVAP